MQVCMESNPDNYLDRVLEEWYFATRRIEVNPNTAGHLFEFALHSLNLKDPFQKTMRSCVLDNQKEKMEVIITKIHSYLFKKFPSETDEDMSFN